MKRYLILLITLFVLMLPEAFSADTPGFDGTFIVEQNDNYPDFTVKDLTTQSFDNYGLLDELGRAGTAMACIGRESFPQEARGSIEEIIPAGWNNAWYDNVEDGFIYNRCHLIGYQLTGNNSVENIITGTHFMNVQGMLPYENWVEMYVANTGNHVLYRVTPLYDGHNLVASAVQMEAYSVEDLGRGICFNVLVYNVQPGIAINYANGETWADESVEVHGPERTVEEPQVTEIEEAPEITYILNTNSHKFHYQYCDSVADMKEKNKSEFYGTREEAIAQGYEPCGRCNP